MKRFGYALVVLFTGLSLAEAQNRLQFFSQADSATQQGRYEEAARLYVRAISSGLGKQSDLYVVAGMSFARAGDKDSAFILLDQAFLRGWRDLKGIENDSSFENLWSDTRWPSYRSKWGTIAAHFEKTFKKPLLEELQRMATEDQEARMPPPARGDTVRWKRVSEIDHKHVARLKNIIKEYGWPGINLAGEKGADAAWLLVQHADFDVEFQKRCLILLTEAVKNREASAIDLAYLTDRVLTNEGKKQVYGTQTHWDDSSKKYVPKPIDDERHVDERREQAGLGPLSVYLTQINELYQPKKGRR
jgi:hypothetical protein